MLKAFTASASLLGRSLRVFPLPLSYEQQTPARYTNFRMDHNTPALPTMAPRHFLDLPAELRIRCYKLVINELKAHVYRNGLVLRRSTGGRQCSLLEACRQTREEVLPLAADLPVHLHYSTDQPAVALPIEYASRVTSITISLDQLRTPANVFDFFPKLDHAVVRTDPEHLPADEGITVFNTRSSEEIKEMVRCRARRMIAYVRGTLSYRRLFGITLELERRYEIRIMDRLGPTEVRKQNCLVC